MEVKGDVEHSGVEKPQARHLGKKWRTGTCRLDYVCTYVQYVCTYGVYIRTSYICTARKKIQYTENVTKYIKKNHQTNDTNSKALNPLVVGITYWILRL